MQGPPDKQKNTLCTKVQNMQAPPDTQMNMLCAKVQSMQGLPDTQKNTACAKVQSMQVHLTHGRLCCVSKYKVCRVHLTHRRVCCVPEYKVCSEITSSLYDFFMEKINPVWEKNVFPDNDGCCGVLCLLQNLSPVLSGEGRRVLLQAIFREVHVQSLVQADRLHIYSIVHHMLNNHIQGTLGCSKGAPKRLASHLCFIMAVLRVWWGKHWASFCHRCLTSGGRLGLWFHSVYGWRERSSQSPLGLPDCSCLSSEVFTRWETVQSTVISPY